MSDTTYIIGGIAVLGAAYFIFEYINNFTPIGPGDPNFYPYYHIPWANEFVQNHGLTYNQAATIYEQFVSTSPVGFPTWLDTTEKYIFQAWRKQYPNANWPYGNFYQSIVNWYKSKGTTFSALVSDY